MGAAVCRVRREGVAHLHLQIYHGLFPDRLAELVFGRVNLPLDGMIDSLNLHPHGAVCDSEGLAVALDDRERACLLGHAAIVLSLY
jgi:hypothetical protein